MFYSLPTNLNELVKATVRFSANQVMFQHILKDIRYDIEALGNCTFFSSCVAACAADLLRTKMTLDTQDVNIIILRTSYRSVCILLI